jgi:peptidoglycan/LPS O-acetylase OafA/YrhL
MIAKRDFGYDLIRTFAILCIFLYHILNRQASNPVVLITINSLLVVSLSLLGFISAALLSDKSNIDFGTFLVKRLTRIYLPLILCLTVVLILHAWIGKTQIGQQVLLHFMGLTAFFKLLGVENKTSIGYLDFGHFRP